MPSFSNFDYSNNNPNAMESFEDGRDREMTDEEYREYYKAEAESEGFDVPYFPNTYSFGRIEPMLDLNECKKEVEPFGELAIKHYNEQNETSFEITEYVKVNTAIAAGLFYFMTFKAKPIGTPADHPTTTFQARVFYGIKDIEVDFCRLSLSKIDR